jgi:Kdo2-lipid IVA lauroyltransferase/acyltransferase
MAKARNDFIDRAQYIALRIVHMFMHCWPVHVNMRIGEIIGDILYRIDARHRKRAYHHIQRSFPHYSHERINTLARQSMRQTICLFFEVLFTTRLIRIDTFTKYVQLGDFKKTLELLMQPDRGLIMITGHYGNWEVLGYLLGSLGFPTLSVARPLDNIYVNRWLLGVRERMGQRIVDKKGATETVTKTLQAHGTVCFIADQNAGPKGLFVDFFNRKASTYKSIALLAMQYNVPVVIGYARRRSTYFEFEIGTQDIIYPHDWADHVNPMLYITQRYTKAIEDFVRIDPGQYLWIHRRWKTRPKGEPAETYD